jgi:hypothetical protein
MISAVIVLNNLIELFVAGGAIKLINPMVSMAIKMNNSMAKSHGQEGA